jgi:tetratricopeptide (TPR) repeat protein
MAYPGATDSAIAEAFFAGRDLTPAEFARVGRGHAAQPDDPLARARTLGYLHLQMTSEQPPVAEYVDTYCWFVARSPGAGILAAALLPEPLLTGETADAIRDAWRRQRPHIENDGLALLNASMAFSTADSPEAIDLARAAARQHPGFTPFLATQQVRRALLHGMSPEEGEAALEELRELQPHSDVAGCLELYGAMVELASACGLPEQARAAARDALRIPADRSPFGGDAHHRAHTALGFVAARQNNLDEAAEHLRASLQHDWSAQAGSLGAYRDVAAALVDAGRTDLVTASLEEAAPHWQATRWTPWRQMLDEGRLPEALFGRRLFLD